MIPAPPRLETLIAGTELVTGLGKSTILADMDFETYSPAGFVWNNDVRKFQAPKGISKNSRKGLSVVGVAVYTEHPDAEVLSLAYNLKDGYGPRLWLPGKPPPHDLFEHIHKGKLVEAWNVSFERWVWQNICVKKYGWPELPLVILRCAAAKARAYGLPGSLDPAGEVLDIKNKKLKDGKRLIEKFCIPRNPTKADPRLRIRPMEDYNDAELFWKYNLRDIEAESELSSLIPDLIPTEQAFWFCDQKINIRGVQLDRDAIDNCIKIVEQAHKKYNSELAFITDGQVKFASELARLRTWMQTQGVFTNKLTEDDIDDLMSRDLPDNVRQALKIRGLIGSAAVKKLYAMRNQMANDGRIHDMFIYHSARTGRAAGAGVQLQNLPNSGPDTAECVKCKCHYVSLDCPWCGHDMRRVIEWNPKAVDDALTIINTGSLECVEYYFDDAIATVSACLRGLIISAPGHDLICSDYSAIEAVVLAALAGEEWRLEVFKTHGQIYEMSAAKVTGLDFQEFGLYKSQEGKHHPYRKIGKVAELASGYQGWLGAWKQFGADEFFSDDEIKQAILAWRDASPNIVEFWGGQQKKWQSHYYGLEGAAILATLSPGVWFNHNSISYIVKNDILYCQLPSGRNLCYHKPRLAPSTRRENTYALSFETWNANPTQGKPGWIRLDTYGGKLTENVVQAVARDILAYAIINLENAGYPVVIHVHDEIVVEVSENFGSVAEVEFIMSTMPEWAKDWPLKAKGGWRDKRYQK